MICPRCGADLPDTALMCYNCKTQFQPMQQYNPNQMKLNGQDVYIKPRPKKTGIIIAAVLVVVIFIVGAALIFKFAGPGSDRAEKKAAAERRAEEIAKSSTTTEAVTEKTTEEVTEAVTESISESTTEDVTTEAITTEAVVRSDDDISPEFKEYMDSYEEFMNRYCDYMEKALDPSQAHHMDMDDYQDIMNDYFEFSQKISEYQRNTDQMTRAEMEYFRDVMNRTNDRLLSLSSIATTATTEE